MSAAEDYQMTRRLHNLGTSSPKEPSVFNEKVKNTQYSKILKCRKCGMVYTLFSSAPITDDEYVCCKCQRARRR